MRRAGSSRRDICHVCRGERRGDEQEEARRGCMPTWRERKGWPAASWMKKLPEGGASGHACQRPRRRGRVMGLYLQAELRQSPMLGSSKVHGASLHDKFTGPGLVPHPLGPFPVSTVNRRWLSPPFAGVCGAGWGLRPPPRPRGRTGICSLAWSRSRSAVSRRPWRRLPPPGPTATAPSGSPPSPRSSARRLLPRRTS